MPSPSCACENGVLVLPVLRERRVIDEVLKGY